MRQAGPKPGHKETTMPINFYFYDETVREIDTPLNGIGMSWTGSALTTDGRLACDGPDAFAHMMKDSRGRITRTEISGRRGYPNGKERFITIADFPGRTRVLVKEWSPVGAQWFWLAAGPTPISGREQVAA